MKTELDYEPDVCDECGVDREWMNMKFDKFQSELDDSHSKIAKLERIITKLKEDGERLATPTDTIDGKMYCRHCVGWGWADEGVNAMSHASDCPVELHRQLLKKIEEEEK